MQLAEVTGTLVASVASSTRVSKGYDCLLSSHSIATKDRTATW